MANTHYYRNETTGEVVEARALRARFGISPHETVPREWKPVFVTPIRPFSDATEEAEAIDSSVRGMPEPAGDQAEGVRVGVTFLRQGKRYGIFLPAVEGVGAAEALADHLGDVVRSLVLMHAQTSAREAAHIPGTK